MSSEKLTKEDVLAQAKSAFGFVPNLIAGIADQNPAVAAAYLDASAVLESGVLAAKEQQIVMLAASAFNDCHYCTAAHRTAAKSMGVPQAELAAIDERRAPADARLRRLAEATWTIMSARGWLTGEARDGLGLSTPEVYEIIALIALKTITNYINHLQHTELDAPLRAQATRDAHRAA